MLALFSKRDPAASSHHHHHTFLFSTFSCTLKWQLERSDYPTSSIPPRAPEPLPPPTYSPQKIPPSNDQNLFCFRCHGCDWNTVAIKAQQKRQEVEGSGGASKKCAAIARGSVCDVLARYVHPSAAAGIVVIMDCQFVFVFLHLYRFCSSHSK